MRSLKRRASTSNPAVMAPPINLVIDLSHHNGSVDFDAVHQAGIIGVIHKATQGVSFIDPVYVANRGRARTAGLLWGAYHFGTGSDGLSQADHFLDSVRPKSSDLIALDFEANPVGPSITLEEARAFATRVHDAVGRWPGLYAGHYLKGLLGVQPDPILCQCWFWLAQYSTTAVVPPAWQTWTMWQYTDGGHGPPPHEVQGAGLCDRDKFNGDLDGLHRLWGA